VTSEVFTSHNDKKANCRKCPPMYSNLVVNYCRYC